MKCDRPHSVTRGTPAAANPARYHRNTMMSAAVALLVLPSLATAMTDAEYTEKFNALTRSEGERVRTMDESMGMGWVEMVDMDEDGVVSEEEMHHMALMPDEDNADDMAIVEGLKSYYLSKPENVKIWEDTKMHEFSAFPDAGNDLYEWFKHSGFFEAYLKLYDRDGDGAFPAPSLLSVRAVAVATYIDLLL